jgi:hypothetical protein
MKAKFFVFAFAWVCLVQVARSAPLGSGFSYQGRLNDGAAPASGQYDFQFRLFDAAMLGTQILPTVTTNGVLVSNGVFLVTLDFGAGAFAGDARWLETSARTNGAVSFTLLSPRQPLLTTPHALYAPSAGTAAIATIANGVALNGVNNTALQDSSITGGKIANGQVVRSINALHDDVSLVAGVNVTLTPSGNNITIASPTWSLNGNGSADPTNFLGTIDRQPLELRVNGSRGLRLEYTSRSGPLFSFAESVNVIGGYWGNSIPNTVIGGVIAGGGDSFALFGTTPYPNAVLDDFGAIGGGYSNVVGYASCVPGGYINSATGAGSFAAGRNAHTTYNGSFIWGDGTRAINGSGNNRFEVLASGGMFFYNGSEGLNLDQLGLNDGSIFYGLRLGIGSGEGIGSKRTTGGNQWGLDFYTAYANRMVILNNGFVGIGTTTPQQQLEVNGGFMVVDGFGGEQAYLGGDGFGNDVQVGSLNPGVANVAFYNAANNTYMNVYVRSLTVVGGADVAEPFEMSSTNIPRGAVVVIDKDNPGHLTMSDRAYDTRVAGIVSGANGVNPGISMSQQGLLEGGQNVALSGRVYALADASNGPIEPGDLLTTAAAPGHAMKVVDHLKAQGAILGKAMTELKEGRGVVLVLVSLQ